MTSSSDSAPTSSTAQLNESESLQRLVREQQETIQMLRQTIERMDQQLKQKEERIEQLEAEVRLLKKIKGRQNLKQVGLMGRKLIPRPVESALVQTREVRN
jgi:predicted RNase H-like nuclease (RuvC/YqgF family)